MCGEGGGVGTSIPMAGVTFFIMLRNSMALERSLLVTTMSQFFRGTCGRGGGGEGEESPQ